ncbi:MAG: hypothetical protein M1816_007926 [Peltula sp. TS41687]|nr:MAG: hypothetical protein M1816_007926 [Peltula sp. TS41687]
MSWIIRAGPYDRPQLNERPIYLRTNFYILAVIQTCWHLYYDYDRVVLPYRSSYSSSNGESQIIPSPEDQLKSKLPRRAERTFRRSLSMVVLGPLIYQLFLRRFAWRWTIFFAAKVWALPRSSSMPPKVLPYHISVILRTISSSYMLMMLWELANLSFEIYVAQEPLKKGKPLTDYARDPNGTLLTGLKSKREVSRAFAFWELSIICKRFPTRRKSFFEDIDRNGGPTWTQVLNVCLGTIQSMNSRVTESMKSSSSSSTALTTTTTTTTTTTSTSTPSTPAQPSHQLTIHRLPRISTPLKDDPIFRNPPSPSSRRGQAQERLGSLAKSAGLSPPSTRKGWTPIDLLSYIFQQASDRLLTPEQKRLLSSSHLSGLLNETTLSFLRTALGQPFRQPLQRRAICTLLGASPADIDVPVCAISALAQLATCSLTEDPFGKVAGDVPLLIRTFRDAVTVLEGFQAGFRPHWSDVQARDEGVRSGDFESVDELLGVLRGALGDVLEGFGKYAGTLGLDGGEMRAARRAAGMGD